ncbi:hypothetical protein BDC45DRAFT_540237 [Circinella umbellata]|nr:hypothetical protein BDC45DRAFT_540237 [Circinella umbellata]
MGNLWHIWHIWHIWEIEFDTQMCQKFPMVHNWIIAMDWAGSHAYAYTLTYNDNYIVAKSYQDLMISIRVTQLKKFKETLDFLFKWKNSLSDLYVKLDNELAKNNNQGVVIVETPNSISTNLPPVLITPKAQKRKIDLID